MRKGPGSGCFQVDLPPNATPPKEIAGLIKGLLTTIIPHMDFHDV